MTERVFHELMARVGNQHAYQKLVTVTCGVVLFTVGATFFFNAFLFYQNDYSCPKHTPNCQEYVCALPQQQRGQFLSEDVSSLASRFGDYRCEGKDQIYLVESIVYMAGAGMCLLGCFFLHRLTHRRAIIYGLVLSLAGLTLTLLSPSMEVACVGLALNFAAVAVQNEVLNSILPEITSEAIRLKCMLVVFLLFSMGASLTALIFWLVQPWQLALVVEVVVPSLGALFVMLRYVEETPMELVINHSPPQIVRAFSNIARMNGKDCDITEEEVAEIKHLYQQNQRAKHEGESVSALDLFRYSSLRSLMLITLAYRFLINFQFYGPQLVLDEYASDIYSNGIIIGLSEVVATLACLPIISVLPRKTMLIAFSLTQCLIALPLFLFYSCNQEECSQSERTIQTVGVFLLRLTANISFVFLYGWKTEVFPSQVRVLALNVSGIASRSGVMIVPLIQHLFDRHHLSIMLAFVVAAILMTLVSLVMRETLGIPPPQIIPELDYENKGGKATLKERSE